MDPISALSVAAAAVQFIQFSVSLVSKTHEIYNSADGALAGNIRTEEATKRLKDLAESLQFSPVSPSGLPSPSSTDSRALREICANCIDISRELLERLDKLRLSQSTSHRKWKSFRQALKSVWSKDGLESIRSRLVACKEELDLHMTISIREKVHDSSFQQSLAFASLDRKAQLCIQYLLENWKNLDQRLLELQRTFIKENQEEHLKTRTFIEVSTSQQAAVTIEKRESQTNDFLLQALGFPSISHRRDGVSHAHAETFQWIFHKPPAAESTWDNFTDWLENGQDIYWINGKAGSGKSTLMRYILEHPKTFHHLEITNPGVQVLGFFFWNSGSEIQRSHDGLLRTLLFDTLQSNPHLTRDLFPDLWAAVYSAYSQNLRPDTIVWTSKELRSAFARLTSLATPDFQFCFFIDGLDEYDGDYDDIALFFKSFSPAPHVKLCISSRPLLEFEEAFQDSPGLRLQYLTYNDISAYVRHEFQEHPMMLRLGTSHPEHATELVTELVTKASGVFLWVTLVVRSLLRGLRYQDHISDLRGRLNDIPADLKALYKLMLHGIDAQYKERAFSTFQTYELLKGVIRPIYFHSIVTANVNDTLSPEVERLSAAGEAKKEERMRLYLKTHCAGLLEVHQVAGEEGYVVDIHVNINTKNTGSIVQYLHRSAREYLATEEARNILSSLPIQQVVTDANKSILMSCIARLKQFEKHNQDSMLFSNCVRTKVFLRYLDSVIEFAKAAGDHTSDYISLMDLLGKLGNEIWGKIGYLRKSMGRTPWPDLKTCDDEENNFLSYAAFEGLHFYVKAKLHDNSKFLNAKAGQSLLDYATHHRFCSKSLELLLTKGADPNHLWNGNTPWQKVLTILHSTGRPSWGIELDGSLNIWQHWAKAIRLFLEHGANPYTTCIRNHCIETQCGCEKYTVLSVIADVFEERDPKEAETLTLLAKQKMFEYKQIELGLQHSKWKKRVPMMIR